MSKAKIGFISLGCPKNQVDTEIMLRELVEAGYPIVAEDIEADIIIINTCAFIESAKKEAIDNILDVAWLKENRNLQGIIVTGCLAQRYREEILESLPEVDALLGVNSIHDIVKCVRAVENKRKVKFTSFKNEDELTLGGDRVVTTQNFAYLKIAEGCDNRCTYCAIPGIRGSFRSRRMEDIINEAKDLEKLDIKELVIVAQDTTRYGEDIYGEYKLAELLHRLGEETSIPWIRILYCYPDKITNELIREIAENDKVVKYIDMPVQHINDDVLRRMNRHGDSAVIKDAIERLRKGVPGIIIRSTAIAGFPGETEEQFEELCEFIGEVKFERFGAFAYSREEDTPAYDLPCQIEEQTKIDRADMLMRKQVEISAEFNQKQLGNILTVICEGFDPVSETHFGRSYMDAPEIDGKVYFTSDTKIPEGNFVKVEITDILDYDLIGEALV
ncbi:MAG: 30S ribosomal protein S12 methylthiotransferase RimO [Ruminococcaceae bacterium]|nr:30S ribosomal protein S12 methylthiotransferase RimO [Oscillospiraceae bacterium]